MSNITTPTQAMSIPELGTHSWIELPATDLFRAINFYTQALGFSWSTPVAPSTPTSKSRLIQKYTFFQKDNTNGWFVEFASSDNLMASEGCGKSDEDDENSLKPRFIVVVEDIDEGFAVIERAGGRLREMKKELQSNMGYAAWCGDTEGNMFELLAQNGKKENTA